MREAGPPAAFSKALAAVQRVLDKSPTPGALIGGVAVIAHGVARFTEDIDATVVGAGLDVDELVRAFRRERIAPRIPDWRYLVETSQVLLLVHEPTGIDVDLSLAWLPFETEAIADAERLPFGKGLIRVVPVDALVIYKAIAHRPQDLVDLERLLTFHDVDVQKILGVLSLLQEHLEGSDRALTLNRILASLPADKAIAQKGAGRPPPKKAAQKSQTPKKTTKAGKPKRHR